MTVLVLLSSKEKGFCPKSDGVLQASNESVLRSKLAKIVDACNVSMHLLLVVCLANKNKESNPKYERLHHASAMRAIRIFFQSKDVDYDFVDCDVYSYDKCA